jgi:DNA polymerase-3 subunit delta
MIIKNYEIEKNIHLLNKYNLVLFFGENLGFKNEIKDKIKNEKKEFEKINLSQDEVVNTKEILYNEILNYSLFDKKKIFFINQVNDKILSILAEIEGKLKDQQIILFSEILEKKSKLRGHFEKSKNLLAIPCYADSEITIKNIIKERLKDFKDLNAVNLSVIAENCKLDRSKLNNELKKILSCFSDKQLDTEKLNKLLNTTENDDFNILKDEALAGHKLQTNKLLSETQIDNDKKVFYINSINQRLLKLLDLIKITKTKSIESAINEIKPPIFWKDKPILLNQSKRWSNNKINKILNETYKLELEVKSNSLIDHRILIKKLLIDICNLANS